MFDIHKKYGFNLKLNLGCGNSPSPVGYLGVDRFDGVHVDIVGDIFDVLSELEGGSVSEIYCSHFFCHFNNWHILLKELNRVLKINGVLNIICPHFSNAYYYSDSTHLTSCGLYSFSYFFKESLLKRRVPKYYPVNNMMIVSIEYNFKSPKPFYFRYLIRKFFGFFVNLNYFTMEFYEEFFSNFISAYEIKFKVLKIEE